MWTRHFNNYWQKRILIRLWQKMSNNCLPSLTGVTFTQSLARDSYALGISHTGVSRHGVGAKSVFILEN